MIFYFSGTGNSRWIAEQLSSRLGERLVTISDAFAKNDFFYRLDVGETIGFVFPTYSWGPAPVMVEFIKRLRLEGYTTDNYCFMVTSCGDDIGLSVDIWKKSLQGIRADAAFSVQMPNNYILLPGFDVDDKELEENKKFKAVARVEYVAKCLKERRSVIDVTEGAFAWVKTRLIYPLFSRYSMSDSKFRVDSNVCTHCGACVRNCPVKNITLSGNGVPEWHGNCAMCLACIHRCPVRAIDYAKATQKKGRYFFK